MDDELECALQALFSRVAEELDQADPPSEPPRTQVQIHHDTPANVFPETGTDIWLHALLEARLLEAAIDLISDDEFEVYQPIDLDFDCIGISLLDLLESSIYAVGRLRSRRNGLRAHFRVSLRGLAGEGLLDPGAEGAVGIDAGGPFQNWLGRLAHLLFSPRAALFLPANHDGRTWTRISPLPGIGCVEPSVARRLGAAGGHLELYRLAGNVLGLALRPRVSAHGIPSAHAPVVLGDVVRFVPSVCRQLLLGDDYLPRLHDLWSARTPRRARQRRPQRVRG